MSKLGRMWGCGAVMLALAGAGCGKPPEVKVKVGSVAAGVADSKTPRKRTPRSLQSGESFASPAVAKMRISLVGGIDLCTGTYGTPSDNCSARVVTFDQPVQVELSNQGGSDVDLSTLGTVQAVPAGSYTHARLSVASAFSLMAAFHTGNDTLYTTTTGLNRAVGKPFPNEDYDFQPMADLYPGLDDSPQGLQETTYFAAPLEHDGTSPLEVKLLVDIVRSGRFTEASTDATFVPAYPNYYVTFNAMGAAEVETYAIGIDEADAQSYLSPLMTVLLTNTGEFLGGRTRFDDGLGQFVKDWSCDANRVCSFKLGDWGTGAFPQSVSGFARQSVGAGGPFNISDDTGTSVTLHALRLSYE